MSDYASIPDRRFYRNRDRAMLGGVCAGIAEYFGFRLCPTRFLAIVALIFFTPFTVVAYLAIMFLVPARPRATEAPNVDPGFTSALRSSPQQTMSDLRRRFQTLDRRLARLEKYVTSSRYQLDREFKELER